MRVLGRERETANCGDSEGGQPIVTNAGGLGLISL